MSEDFGIIGLELIGSALAHRLQDSDHHIYGFDPEELGEMPFYRHDSARDVFAQCREAFLSRPDNSVSTSGMAVVGHVFG